MPRMPSRIARRPSILVVTALVAAFVAACSTASPVSSPASDEAAVLPGTTWRLVSLGGVTPAGDIPTLELGADGSATGSTGCNSFTARYSIDGATLVFSPLAMTKRGCEPAIASQETAFVKAMTRVTGWTIGADDRLVLAGPTELVFERA
jgi:heat shock protein HslJ